MIVFDDVFTALDGLIVFALWDAPAVTLYKSATPSTSEAALIAVLREA